MIDGPKPGSEGIGDPPAFSVHIHHALWRGIRTGGQLARGDRTTVPAPAGASVGIIFLAADAGPETTGTLSPGFGPLSAAGW
jgi:hypothetical protein